MAWWWETICWKIQKQTKMIMTRWERRWWLWYRCSWYVGPWSSWWIKQKTNTQPLTLYVSVSVCVCFVLDFFIFSCSYPITFHAKQWTSSKGIILKHKSISLFLSQPNAKHQHPRKSVIFFSFVRCQKTRFNP